MKRTLLSTLLLSILSPGIYADTPPTLTTGPTTTSTVTTTTVSAQAPATAQAQAPVLINCLYHIPADTTTIDPAVITTWVKNATIQSFTFQADTLDQQLAALKPCYTDQGFLGFQDAMQKSGNIGTIKSQHLTVSSSIETDPVINPVKDNQWKVSVPLQVVYQSSKEKLMQQLTIDLLVGRKMSGDLGIIQIIATPRQPTPPQNPGTVAH